jgi:hypothetical protein
MATAMVKSVVAKAQEDDKVKETENLSEILSFVNGMAQALGLDLDTVKVKVSQIMSTEFKLSPSKPGPAKKQRTNPTVKTTILRWMTS